MTSSSLLSQQGRPGSYGAQHAILLGPEPEERRTGSRVQAEVRHGGVRQDGPGRGDRGHREPRTQEVLGVSEEGGPGGGGLLPGSEHSGRLTPSHLLVLINCVKERGDAHPSTP